MGLLDYKTNERFDPDVTTFTYKSNLADIDLLLNSHYSGIVMPRYEHSDDKHIVLKLKSGYNIGLEINKIEKIEKNTSVEKNIEKNHEDCHADNLPNILVSIVSGPANLRLAKEEISKVLKNFPELGEIGAGIQKGIFKYSENIMPEHWLKIAETIKEYSESNYVGIIIAHGTDTMHYTSSYLSFSLAGFPIPIALVGSQRSSDRASSDAALNLIGAVKFLIESKTNGIYVAMHQDENDETIACHIGTRVRKNHTSKRGAFQTVGNDPAFLIVNNEIHKNMKTDFFTIDKFDA